MKTIATLSTIALLTCSSVSAMTYLEIDEKRLEQSNFLLEALKEQRDMVDLYTLVSSDGRLNYVNANTSDNIYRYSEEVSPDTFRFQGVTMKAYVNADCTLPLRTVFDPVECIKLS